MTAAAGCVIVGAGAAGAATAEALRDGGWSEPITLLGQEPNLPYDRPPLSKSYLQGRSDFGEVFLHESVWYDQQDVRLLLDTPVTAIDPTGRTVTAAGHELPYDVLVLATGSTARRLPIPGADLDGVYCLRTLPDSQRLRVRFQDARRMVIIGAGWIGLEVAAAARAGGIAVTVLESAPLPLLRVLGEQIAPVFADLHREHDVDLRLGVSVEAVTGERQVTGVLLADGSRIPADLVLFGVGATPNTELAEQAGLSVDDGIRTDATLRTSAPDVYAVGDVARADHPLFGVPIRVEHWDNAHQQPKTAAAAILGRPAAYAAVPYFFTDQYDLGMEYAGHLLPDKEHRVIVRGDLARREFIAFWLDTENRPAAAMNVNIWDVNDTLRALVAARRPVEPRTLADPGVPLETMLA